MTVSRLGERAGDTLALVKATLASLPPGEAQVARIVLERPFDVLSWSVAELAAVSETSTATVVRTCHRLGLGGLPDLRLRLARDIGWTRAPYTGTPPTELQRIAEGLFRRTAQGLEAMAEEFDGPALEAAAQMVQAARRVLIAAVGPTQVLAYDLAYSLNLVGRTAELPSDMGLQRVAARGLCAGDLLISVSLTGANPQTLQIAELAHAAGASVLLITCFAPSRISELADVTLVTGNHNVVGLDSDGPINVVAVLLLLRALAAVLATRLGTDKSYPDAVQALTDGIGLTQRPEPPA